MTNGKMIVVDLTKESIDVTPMRDDLIENYIGGEGTGTRLLWEMVKPRTDALSPGNAVAICNWSVKWNDLSRWSPGNGCF